MASKPLVLIVDDDPNFREIFSMKLGDEGYRVALAENGPDGIEKARQLQPGLVLMDVKMGRTDGVETMMKMRENPETKNIPVVFLTNFGNPEEEMQEMSSRFSREIGAAGYIKKSDDLDAVVSKVKAFI